MTGRMRRLGAAVAMIAGVALLAPAGASADVQVSPNWALIPDANPIYGRDGLGMAVNPSDPDHVVALYADWTSLWCEVAVSRDAGRNWRRTRLKAPEGFFDPPCTVGGHLSQMVDGGIAFGARGTVYATFASARGTDEDQQGQSALVAKSGDGGRSFSTGVVALAGGEDADDGPDYSLPKLTVVPGRDGRSRNDRIHVVAASQQAAHDDVQGQDVAMATSTDGGRSWSAPVAVNPAGRDAIEPTQPVVGKGGDLYVGWRSHEPGTPPRRFSPQGAVVVSRSTDRGATWTSTDVARVEGFVYDGPTQGPFLAQGQAFDASTFPRLAADRRSGAVYLVYGNGKTPGNPVSASASDHFIHFDLDVWFQRSPDRGRTWSDPVRLNGQPPISREITQTRHPNVSVAPDGRVDVVWNDRRHWYRGCPHTHLACQEARLGDIYLRSSTDGGRSFGDEHRITDRSMNGDVGFDYRFGSYWDYGPVAVPLGRDRLLVGFMDSRDGNFETDNQGLWLAEVDFEAKGRAVKRKVRARNATDLAVKLSRHAYPAGAEAVLAATFATRPWSRAVIVYEHDVPGALAGAVLARAFLGPLLLADRDGMTPRTRAELARFAPLGAFVIGSDDVLGQEIVDEIVATGVPADQVQRITRPGDLAGTAADMAFAMDRRTQADKDAGKPAFDAVMLVNPKRSNAYAAAALAANRRLPVLFTEAGELPASTVDALQRLAIDKVLIVGPPAAISNRVAQQLPDTERLNGNTAVGVSRAAVLAARDRGVPDNVVYAGRASHEMHSALLGAAAGRAGGLLLLTDRRHGVRRVLRSMDLEDEVDQIITAARPKGR